MTGQPQKYVFRELVQDRTDALQLISYAIYKSHKDERANYFHAKFGKASVSAKLQDWHDGIVSDPQWLETYRTKAKALIKEIETQAVENAMPTIESTHQGEINALKDTHKNEVESFKQRALDAEKKAHDDWIKKTDAWAANQTKPGRLKKGSLALLNLIGGSVISVLGGAIATACIVGILAMVFPSLSASANSIAEGLVDKLLPSEDPTGLDIKSFTSEEQASSKGTKP